MSCTCGQHLTAKGDEIVDERRALLSLLKYTSYDRVTIAWPISDAAYRPCIHVDTRAVDTYVLFHRLVNFDACIVKYYLYISYNLHSECYS